MRPWFEGLKRKAQGLNRKWSESAEGLNRKWSGIWGSSGNLEAARAVAELVKEGKRCDSAAAVDAFRRAVAIRPNDHELLVCLSKSLSDRVFEVGRCELTPG